MTFVKAILKNNQRNFVFLSNHIPDQITSVRKLTIIGCYISCSGLV
jgi:hypothetical protein